MGWIVLFCLCGIVGVGALIVAVLAGSDPVDEGTRYGALGISVIAGLLAIISTFLFMAHSVPNGHVGLVSSFGKITSQRGNGAGGFVLIAPWQTIRMANVQVQSMCANGNPPPSGQKDCKDNYGTFSSESIDVFVNAKLNFHVNPEHIQSLYRTVGPDYESKIIQPRVAQVIKEETVKFTAIDIAPHREDIRKAATQRLVTELADRSIVADDFLLTNIDFNDTVKKSIDQKVVAAQNAAAATAKVEQSKAEAEQARQVAQGQADARRIAAQAESDSNDLINKSLSSNILQLRLAQTLGDKIQFVPSGAGVIVDPASLLKKP